MKTLDFSLGGVDKVFRTPGSAAENKHIVILPLSELHQHPQLKVEVRQDSYLDELTESIRKNGLLEEIRAFPDPDGGYWIISGRHRCMAAQRAGLSEVPVILDDTMTGETAEIAITDCNLRHELGTMEKAWTYRIKREAESRQGYRSDLHPEEKDLSPTGQEVNIPTESERTIQRYIRLTYLVPELQALVDRQGKTALKVRTGEALSFLDEKLQIAVYEGISLSRKFPDMETAEHWKSEYARHNLSRKKIMDFFSSPQREEKKSVSVSLPYSDVAGAIPAGYGKKQITELVQELLTEWAKKNDVVFEDPFPNLKVGEYIESHGALLKWGELRIGMKVVEDCSTVSHKWFRIMQVEKMVKLDTGENRVILRDGSRSQSYINRSYIDRGNVKLYRPATPLEQPKETLCDTCISNGECAEKKTADTGCLGYEKNMEQEVGSSMNQSCKTGLNPYGICGAAGCDQPYDCCLNCPEDCNIRCGWIEKGAK